MINKAFWAKKQDNHGYFQWLPLNQHLEDTRQVIGRLWELWLCQGQRDYIEASLHGLDTDGKKLSMFLASIHDISKAIPAFQIKRGFNNSQDLDIALLEKLERAGFTGISDLMLSSINQSHHTKGGQALLTSYGILDDISSIIAAHHGKPMDRKKDYSVQLSAYPTNYFQVESQDDPIHKKWDYEQHAIFQWALETNDYNSVNDLPHITQPAQVILSGLLIMADWIASNERYFPLIPLEQDEVENQEERFKFAWSNWQKTGCWEAMYQSDIKYLYGYRFKFKPRDVQEAFAELINKIDDLGIIIFEAPMGIGKTEAALAAVELLAYKTGRSGLFFGLPTQATSNGIFPRIEAWLESVADDFGDQLSIRLSHGKASLNPMFENLSRNVDIDGSKNGSVIVNEWFSGRKTAALDDFVVGTVDQFLMIALKQKHLALRHLGMSKKIVVIDEVHAYDVYMSQYLYEAVRWMGAYGVPVIILSATLPAEKRQDLVKSYLEGKGISWRKAKKHNDRMAIDAYPLVTYTDGKEVKQYDNFNQENCRLVTIVREKSECLYELIAELIKEGGVIGIMVNTVKKAQEVAKRCTETFKEEKVELLHSRFIATDRVKKENELISMIGKNADRPRSKIIIGTQVIEQSLDIDFDVLISDLAPMDLLIQRLGRLHRHDIQRNSNHAKPVLYVLGTSETFDFDEGSIAVYGSYILSRTQYFLPKEIILPNDISPLVQKVYGHEEISIKNEIQKKYETFKSEQKAFIQKKKTKAYAYQIENPELDIDEDEPATLTGWLKNINPNESEEHAYAQVRDSNDTIEILALKKVGEGYGFFETEEDISNQIEDFYLAKEIANHSLQLPTVLSAPYNIDETIRQLEEYNIKHLSSWQKQAWLKGALGLVFDENNEAFINGYQLKYDQMYGLTYERM